jgi:DNA helicase-2/ATP-dependent DNA helicase PcrA
MEKLYITHAESRRLHGTDTFNPPSRFLREIPKDLIDEIRPRAQTNIPYNRKDFKETKMEFEEEIGIALGQKVQHKKFGEGIVLNYEGSGESCKGSS